MSISKVSLQQLKEYYSLSLLAFLEECEGSKAIVWDDELTGPVGLLCEYSALQEREVTKMFSLSVTQLQASDVKHIIFLVKPLIPHMNVIADLVRRDELAVNRKLDREYHILFVPHTSELCVKKLKEQNVYGSFKRIESYPLHLIPLDTDLLSMENPRCIKDLYLDQDFSCLHDVASSIMRIQEEYGIIQNVFSKGECSKRVLDMMVRMRREQAASEESKTPQIDNIILLDRSTDLLTPFMSQLTYEGLIDELMGIKNTTIKVPADKFSQNPEGSSEQFRKIILTSKEELFAELRDKNFNAVGPTLSSKAKIITAQYDEKNQAKTVGEIKQFVSKLPHIQAAKQSLANHTVIAEMVKDLTVSEEFLDGLRCQQEFLNGIDTDKISNYIDDCISKGEPINKVLRLIAIQSFCNNGLKPQVLRSYKSAVIQAYGFDTMILLSNMEKAGFIKLQGPYTKTYSNLKKTLKLVVEDVNEKNPTDIAYVYSGYAPLSIRLAQQALKPGWRSIQNVMQLLPGDTIEEVQQLPDGVRKRRGSITSSHSATSLQADPRVTLIYFLGGVTYAEISALRFLQQEADHPTEYIIATTHIINGHSLIDSIDVQLTPISDTGNPF